MDPSQRRVPLSVLEVGTPEHLIEQRERERMRAREREIEIEKGRERWRENFQSTSSNSRISVKINSVIFINNFSNNSRAPNKPNKV